MSLKLNLKNRNDQIKFFYLKKYSKTPNAELLERKYLLHFFTRFLPVIFCIQKFQRMSRTQPNLPRTRTISQAIRDWRFSQGNYPPTQQTQAGSSSAWSQELNPGDFQEVVCFFFDVLLFYC